MHINDVLFIKKKNFRGILTTINDRKLIAISYKKHKEQNEEKIKV